MHHVALLHKWRVSGHVSPRILPVLGLLFSVSRLQESGELKVHCNELYWQYNGLS